MDFVEPIIAAALARLEDELPAAIAAYNADDETVVELAEPSAYVFGAMDPLVVGAGPVIEIAAQTGATGPWAIGAVEVDHFPQVAVVIWHEGERGELSPTYRMSLGLARCVISVLRERGAFGPDAIIANEPGAVTWRTDVIPADPVEEGRDFRRWQVPVLITFRLETVERFG